jgi:hypothetical protein
MFCQKCGAQNPDDALFCVKCGTKLIVSSDSQPTSKKGLNRILDFYITGGEEIERVLGAYYQPRSIEETAKIHGYNIANLSTTKLALLKELALLDYELYKTKNEYKLAKSWLGPTVLGIIGLLLLGIGIGIIIIVIALIWYLIRVVARGHIYQRQKDLEIRCSELEKRIVEP